MSNPGRAPDRVVKDVVTREGSAYSAIERLVAIALADHLNQDGIAWPSVARLQAWTGLGETSVKAALKALCGGPRALFDRHVSTGLGSCTYRLRDNAGEGVATRPGSPRDPVASRLRPGRHATLTGSPRDPGTPNRTPHRTPTGLAALARRDGRPADATWTRVLRALEGRVKAHSFSTWLKPLQPIGIVDTTDGELLVVAARAEVRDWVEENYRQPIDAALVDAGVEHLLVAVVSDDERVGHAHGPPRRASRAG
jgi:hypothetical protein